MRLPFLFAAVAMAKVLGKRMMCDDGGMPMSENTEMRLPEVDGELSVVNPSAVMGARMGSALTVAGYEGAAGTALRKSPRPSGCSRFVRREIADAMPSICAMLLTRVMKGDLSSLKLLLQMAASGQGAKPAGRRSSAGFGRKILQGFHEFEARESGARRES